MSDMVFYDPYKAQLVSGDVYDFSQYRVYLGDSFAKAAANAYKAMTGNLRQASEITYFYRICHFLDFLSHNKAANALRHLLLDGAVTSESNVYQIYASATSNYRHYLKQKDTSNRNRNNLSHAASRFMESLAAQGAWVRGVKCKGFKVPNSIGSSLLTAKVLRDVSEPHLTELVEEYRQSWDQADERFFENLLISNDRADISAERLVEMSIKMLQERLSDTQKLCSEIIVSRQICLDNAEKWASDYRVIERANQLHRLFTDTDLTAQEKGVEYQRVLESNPLRTFVVYCKLFCNGIFPRYCSNRKIYSVLSKKIKDTNLSRQTVEHHLIADIRALTAAFGFLMIEFSGNADSIRNLTVDCINPVAGSSDVEISWHKHRRGHDSHESVFSGRRAAGTELTSGTLTPHCVISYVLSATDSVRQHADDDTDIYLFLHFNKNLTVDNRLTRERSYKPSVPAGESLNREFKEVTREVSNGDWEATPKALRTSNLILDALLNRDVFAVQERARHKNLAMGQFYVDSLSTTLMRDQRIREFMEWFETVASVDIEDFAKKAGIDEEAYGRRKKEILNQQFGGLHCSDPWSGIQPGTKEGEVCTKVENCPTCPNRRNIFLVSPENFANVTLFHEALEAAKDNLSEREFEKWKLWHIFTTSVLQNIASKPKHRRDFEQAMEIKDRTDNFYHRIFARSTQ